MLIAIDLREEGESIAGRVIAEGSIRPFAGWIGLFTELDRLVRDDAHSAGGPEWEADGGKDS